jgi:hypothetical protein
MLMRRKRRVGVSDGMDGQDSFLDIVSNIVGILIILVMIAGVRAQNSGDRLPVLFDDDSVGVSVSSSPKLPDKFDDTMRIADEAMVREFEEKFIEYKTKESNAENIRQAMLNIRNTSERISEQIQLQDVERERLLGLLVELRAEVELRAGERGEEAKLAMELRRKISEVEAKVLEIERTKQWLESGRVKALRMENMPTPIGKSVEAREAHFRIKRGKIVYVPINELSESFLHEFNSNRNKFFSKQTTRGRVGPISDFVMDFLVMRYNTPMAGAAGNGVGQRVVMEMATFTTKNNNAGTYYKDAITQTNSDFQRLIQRYRQDIYTITFWVYPDSFDAFCEVKQFLYSKGYRVAGRALEEDDEIKASPRGTKSSAQ